MTAYRLEAIGLGAVHVDHIYTVEQILHDGECVVTESASFPGGSGANTIHGLSRLGLKCGFIGAVGNDPDGNLLISDFENAGIDNRYLLVKNEAQTGSVVSLSESSGRRSTYVNPGANNYLDLSDVNLEYLSQAKLVHMSTFFNQNEFALCHEIAERLAPDILFSFSPGSLFAAQGIKKLAPILSRTNALFTNQQDIEKMTQKNYQRATDMCIRSGCEHVVVTLGESRRFQRKGKITLQTYIRDKDHECHMESTVSLRKDIRTVVDTIGAADAFTTGFLFGLMEEKPIEECGLLGDISARFCIGKLGARSGLPDLEALKERFGMHYFTS
ncbi:carbohydrate kinase family protein [Dehalococcoides mccartyi]|uniref:Carbohydrate kinase, PfkB family n=1 Tax=Dehalococcoides mccartyi (strain ATCC BAA-2266 / KCTC 15142 / 195) TaxID=243164 RepID=Q3Z8J7_DEHM1|nr:carbohydrate kinase family protein [Dehalococcoides mccartyi]AAW39986.1 carbohydrate kinase, PfkB family [Dehalococcoides mccartyi 195]